MGKKLRTTLACMITAAAIGVGAPAFADITYPSGGTWSHGTGGGRVWSNYHHPNRCHGSSVQGEWYEEDYAGAGRWSRADAADTWWVDEAWYKFC